MKRKLFLLLIPISTLLFTSCKKGSEGGNGGGSHPSVPVLTTTEVSSITTTTAQSGGTITSDGGSAITARGVCWSTSFATIAGSKTIDGSGKGSYTSMLANLQPNTFYSIRAYATNSAGTGYGNEFDIFTQKLLSVPTVTTALTAIVTSDEAVAGGEVTSDGNASPVTERGICWSTAQNPTIADSKLVDGPGTGSFVSDIMGLTVNVTYYARAYATNSVCTGYGNQILFTTAYLIGQMYQGGRVFYVDNTHLHGLIAATSDQQGGPWDNNSSGNFASVNAYSYTDGATNTDNIIAVIGNGNAASQCRAYTGGGYTDWYLPSRDELSYLYLEKSVLGNFQNYYYWSSTANETYIGTAWSQDFGSGAQYNNSLKTSLYSVRPIRAF